jgi:ubiquinol-cytochrome c reductase cytochrome b subunit
VTNAERPTPAEGNDRPPPAGRPPARDERPTELERVVGWFDERTGLAEFARTAMRKVFPDHWSFLLGEIALFCFILLVATGVFLTFFFVPSSEEITYTGGYEPLQGQQVSLAFDSVLNLSFDVRAGLLMRQFHHWTALVFVGAIAIHMMRIFFTGAFRRPREINWLIGVSLLLLALVEGFTGYSLPDDQLSGTGLRIADAAILSVPFAGPQISSLLFGGEFPSQLMIGRLFVLHILLLPALLIGLVTLHIGLVFLQKHTAYKGTGATEGTVTGSYFWPSQTFRSTGLFFLTAAILAGIGGIFQINPVWQYGPYKPWIGTVPAQPDWYVGWLEGALRLGLPIEPTFLGVTIPSAFVPVVLLPTLLFGLIVIWPWVERRLTHDTRPHHLLDWPWEVPARTATGIAVLSFFAVQLIAGGNDVLSRLFQVGVDQLNNVLRIALVTVPVILWLLTYRLCRDRQRRELTSAHEPGSSGTAIVRAPDGGFVEEEEG